MLFQIIIMYIMRHFIFLLFPIFIPPILSIPINNAIQAGIKIECGSRSISIQADTENSFVGKFFLKGFSSSPECSSKGTGRLTASLQFDIGLCGTFRQRTLNPRGIQVDAIVVLSFHPMFVTKIDRSYRIVCIYKESEHDVRENVRVGDLSTQFVSQNITMPICNYEILDGGPSGQPARFGIIGQQVYHQWKCESDYDNTFCMFIHTCFINDGMGDQVFMIDSNGCAIDRYILSNIEYPDDLTAGQEAHVYKFADRDALYFQCQISLSIKEPGSECFRPVCQLENDLIIGGGAAPSAPYNSRGVGKKFEKLSTPPPLNVLQNDSLKSVLAGNVEIEDQLIESSMTGSRTRRNVEEDLDVRAKMIVLEISEKKFPSREDSSTNCITMEMVLLIYCILYFFLVLFSFFCFN